MDNFKRMGLFAQIVQHGSLSAAGRALGMSTSAVSQQLRVLEREAGVPLLHRSTRQLALTDVGSRYYAACARLLEAASDAQAQVLAARAYPDGELRLAAPLGMADHLGAALGPWLQANTQLRLQLFLDDGWTDLRKARIDVAVRFGQLPDSDWMAQSLGALQRWACAAPAWLQRHGLPQAPAHVPAAQWLGALPVEGLHWQHHEGAPVWVPVHPRILTGSQPALQRMCVEGLGVAVLTDIDAAPWVASGALVRLFGEWHLPALPAWAVTPRRDNQPVKVREAIAHLAGYVQRKTGTTPDTAP